MIKIENIHPSDLAGIYKEMAEVIGVEAVMKLHQYFQGQQITLPKKLYAKDFITKEVKKGGKGKDIKKLALEYGYTERRLRQILKESK